MAELCIDQYPLLLTATAAAPPQAQAIEPLSVRVSQFNIVVVVVVVVVIDDGLLFSLIVVIVSVLNTHTHMDTHFALLCFVLFRYKLVTWPFLNTLK